MKLTCGKQVNAWWAGDAASAGASLETCGLTKILHPTPWTTLRTSRTQWDLDVLHPKALHPTSYTLHPTPFTLHPTPYTLHPNP